MLGKSDPRSIGPYTIIGRLGRGGMGTVFLAMGGAGLVALKVTRNDLGRANDVNSRFEREFTNQQLSDSPFVASVIESQTDGNGGWIAMEYVPGQNIAQLVSGGQSLSENFWWATAMGCAHALATMA